MGWTIILIERAAFDARGALHAPVAMNMAEPAPSRNFASGLRGFPLGRR
jgi:hypothetical protein